MCTACGCSAPADPHAPAGAGVDPATGDLHYGLGAARVHVPGLTVERALKIEADVLGANAALAAANRDAFAAHGVTAFNLVSSPGAGKTTLLVATIAALRIRRPGLPILVIEGDQQTARDAERIRATGVPAIQVNTGQGCHLDARMVADAFVRLHHHLPHHHHHGADAHAHADHDAGHGHDHDDGHGSDHRHDTAGALLFIENVGNLVCPALWDLGERAKVAVLSVTEGEDKPIKYPDMFAAASLMLLAKTDLLPHVDFDVARCLEYARRVNPEIEVMQVSARTGQGLDAWCEWLLARLPRVAHA